jgi:hypothetical protein
MTKVTAAFLAVAFAAAVPSMAWADCAGHMKTASTPATVADGTGTATPPSTPIPTDQSGG